MVRQKHDRARAALRTVAVVWVASIVALATPLAGPAWSGEPSLFGLPRSMIWVLGWLSAMFASLLWAYLTESGSAPDATAADEPESR